MIIASAATKIFGIVNTTDGKTFFVDPFGDVYLGTETGMTKLNQMSMTISEMNTIRNAGLFEVCVILN